MSAGVISGFGRSFQPVGSNQQLQDLIQIDAAVNPGNSGGPLLNRYGEVIGIVTGLVNPTEQNFFVGIGFAVPITDGRRRGRTAILRVRRAESACGITRRAAHRMQS